MSIQPGPGYTFNASSSGSNLNISKDWSEWDNSGNVPPFTLNNASVGTTYQFAVVAGMVNSVIPQLGPTADPTKRLDQLPAPTTAFNFDATTHYSYIYLKVSCSSGTSGDYPVTTPTDVLYPRVISSATELPSDNNSGYLLLATAYQDPTTHAITIWQLTTESQWSDRLKTGTDTARYYFAQA